MIKLAIVGSRTFNSFWLLEKEILSRYHPDEIEHIYSGGATGADILAERFAKKYEIYYTVFLSQWAKFGRSAGFKRNELIIKSADVVFAFHHNKSKGTQNSIDLAEKYGKILHIIKV
ncbi:MAG: DUF2493 domain-containing protein [Nanoarchaeota archaeon]